MFGKFGEWRFDKRSYSGGAPPKNLSMPPQGVPESVVRTIPHPPYSPLLLFFPFAAFAPIVSPRFHSAFPSFRHSLPAFFSIISPLFPL